MTESNAREGRWIEDPQLPEPRSVTSFPVRHDYRSKYPECRQYAAGEGGGVYTAEGGGAYVIVVDEGSLADLLGIEDECVTIYTFTSAVDRDRYCATRFGKLRAINEFNELRWRAATYGLICPMPIRWNELWDMLPDRHRDPDGNWVPPMPLILAAWHHTSAMEKQARFLDHLRYAADHGVMDRVSAFLQRLRDDEWLRAAPSDSRALDHHSER